MAADLYDKTVDLYRTNLKNHPIVPQCPGRFCWAVTPSDTKDVTNGQGDNAPAYAKALWIGGAGSGNLKVVAAGDTSNSGAGTAITFKNVPVGKFDLVEVRRVMSTGTDVTDIVGICDVMTPDKNVGLAPKQS